MLKLAPLSLLVLALPLTAFGGVASDQVPSSQLTATFQVAAQIPQGGGSPVVTPLVELDRVQVVNGQLQTDKLDQSADDVFTFSIGQTTIKYDPANPQAATLPFTVGATYTANFTRFNGEAYTSTVVMPDFPAFTSPTANQVFNKTDVVNLAWSAVSSQLGEFLLTTDCGAFNSGALAYNSTFTAATIAAGAASGCTGAVQVNFMPVYINSGTGYGSFVAGSIGEMPFSYGAGTTSAPKRLLLSGARLDRLVADAEKTRNHTLQLHF